MLAARTHATTGDLEGAEKLLRRALEKDSTYLAATPPSGRFTLSSVASTTPYASSRPWPSAMENRSRR